MKQNEITLLWHEVSAKEAQTKIMQSLRDVKLNIPEPTENPPVPVPIERNETVRTAYNGQLTMMREQDRHSYAPVAQAARVQPVAPADVSMFDGGEEVSRSANIVGGCSIGFRQPRNYCFLTTIFLSNSPLFVTTL